MPRSAPWRPAPGGRETAAAAARAHVRDPIHRRIGPADVENCSDGRIARPVRRAPNASDGVAALVARVAPMSERRRQNLFVERSRGLLIATRARASRSAAQKFLHLCRRYLLQWVAVETNCALALFRTCLWPCVGRWASGQEAGQPPGARWSRPSGRHDRSSENIDRQPEAKPAHPALNGGRGLKQRRSGLFWSRRPSKGRHRRGLFTLARRAERDPPLQSKASLG